MGDALHNNNDLYSLDYPELLRKVGAGESDREDVVPTNKTANVEGTGSETDHNVPMPNIDPDFRKSAPEVPELRPSEDLPDYPSSPEFILTGEQGEFNARMRKIYTERIAGEQRAHSDRMAILHAELNLARLRRETVKCGTGGAWAERVTVVLNERELQTMLDKRRGIIEHAATNYTGNRFELLAPLDTKLRKQLLRYPVLLAEYYEIEQTNVKISRKALQWTKWQIETGIFDPALFKQLDMLNDLAEARRQDERELNDEFVLGILLNNMDALLRMEISRHRSGQAVGTKRIVYLRPSVERVISRSHKLKMQYVNMDAEEYSVFPDRYPPLKLSLKFKKEPGTVKRLFPFVRVREAEVLNSVSQVKSKNLEKTMIARVSFRI
jgi:hypothetical protein